MTKDTYCKSSQNQWRTDPLSSMKSSRDITTKDLELEISRACSKLSKLNKQREEISDSNPLISYFY